MGNVAAPHLLIDGDVYIYRAAATCEKVINWDDDNYVNYASLSEAKVLFINTISELLNKFETKEYTIALSHYKNFRKEINPNYKANRKDKKPPMVYKPLRQWVEQEYNIFCREYLEGDDILGILATSKVIIKNTNKIIVSLDKDMKTLPCKYHNNRNDESIIVSEQEANYNHMLQTLTGDQADNYKGLAGCGLKTAEKIISKDMSYRQMWQAVVEAYIKKGSSEQVALLNARMARILRNYDYDYERKKPILWSIENEV